ncbi:hypothetical protein F441_09158 [Phytophthora nicotianae CJ01A1]|uniref:Elicitin n=6 Tax=Phytophthora nicotianae TaxID=4792 RepID=W2Q5A4_PHYN3|nr:hypothetical protein PPTG_12160 [Phytophthora nicotianae INRA-310]ETI46404.1 hypothetical protein F443_09202 [Phytophthora nicotianae P1569]ETK86346.1 hypothetical protein L915_09025 [Phytophthora nicotianae]ETO75106.1 hypothetical protein F444_09280 [Phytophthora nicotianae P1976]ETP16214.1 hypothetical protein F441_09158 [Phytophthora nicotianae CJ01A1]ETP44265.1 hypothetical protein F442_09125 [Phytophthora nicotianae P10297]KUF85295.1 Elicitin protein [Phytophthora nicotianae]
MKFVAIVSAAALIAVTNAAPCDVAALQTIITSPDAATCMTDSGFKGTTLVTPTDAELAKMCTSKACQSLLSDAEAAAPTECTVGTFALYADLITPLNRVCNGGSSSGSSTSATVGSTDGSSATVTANSTDSDASASASSSGSSGASMAVVSASAILAAVAATFF